MASFYDIDLEIRYVRLLCHDKNPMVLIDAESCIISCQIALLDALQHEYPELRRIRVVTGFRYHHPHDRPHYKGDDYVYTADYGTTSMTLTFRKKRRLPEVDIDELVQAINRGLTFHGYGMHRGEVTLMVDGVYRYRADITLAIDGLRALFRAYQGGLRAHLVHHGWMDSASFNLHDIGELVRLILAPITGMTLAQLKETHQRDIDDDGLGGADDQMHAARALDGALRATKIKVSTLCRAPTTSQTRHSRHICDRLLSWPAVHDVLIQPLDHFHREQASWWFNLIDELYADEDDDDDDDVDEDHQQNVSQSTTANGNGEETTQSVDQHAVT